MASALVPPSAHKARTETPSHLAERPFRLAFGVMLGIVLAIRLLSVLQVRRGGGRLRTGQRYLTSRATSPPGTTAR